MQSHLKSPLDSMKILLVLAIIVLLGLAAKLVWDTAEIHELHKMRAAFDHRILEIQETYKELKPGLQEAENFIDDELENLPEMLDHLEDILGL